MFQDYLLDSMTCLHFLTKHVCSRTGDLGTRDRSIGDTQRGWHYKQHKESVWYMRFVYVYDTANSHPYQRIEQQGETQNINHKCNRKTNIYQSCR